MKCRRNQFLVVMAGSALWLAGCSGPGQATVQPRAQPVPEPERGAGGMAETLRKYASGEGLERYALVVGVSRYRYADGRKLSNLRYAARDAELFAAFLV